MTIPTDYYYEASTKAWSRIGALEAHIEILIEALEETLAVANFDYEWEKEMVIGRINRAKEQLTLPLKEEA